MAELPEDYKMRFAHVAAEFRTKYPTVTHEDMVKLMKEVVAIYSDVVSDSFKQLRRDIH